MEGTNNCERKIVHEVFQIRDWNHLDSVSFVDIDVPVLSVNILNKFNVFVYYQLPEGVYVSLPHRTFIKDQLLTSIDAVFQIQRLRIICSTNLDRNEVFPSENTQIAIIAIHPLMQANCSQVDFLNYAEIRKHLL